MTGEKVIIALGELSQENLESTLRFLGEKGLSTEIVDPQRLKSWERAHEETLLPYSVDEITEPEKYLVKEHFSEFRAKYRDYVAPSIAGYAFSVVTRPAEFDLSIFYPRGKYQKPPKKFISPDSLGLIVANRKQANLPNPKYLSQYPNLHAVRANSLVNFVRNISPAQRRNIIGLSDRTEAFLIDIAEHLEEQLKD